MVLVLRLDDKDEDAASVDNNFDNYRDLFFACLFIVDKGNFPIT